MHQSAGPPAAHRRAELTEVPHGLALEESGQGVVSEMKKWRTIFVRNPAVASRFHWHANEVKVWT